jgi:hypothetical protein
MSDDGNGGRRASQLCSCGSPEIAELDPGPGAASNSDFCENMGKAICGAGLLGSLGSDSEDGRPIGGVVRRSHFARSCDHNFDIGLFLLVCERGAVPSQPGRRDG